MDKTNNNKLTYALYIVMALIIVAVIGVTVFSIVSHRKSEETAPAPKETETEAENKKTPLSTKGLPEPELIPKETGKESEKTDDSKHTSDPRGFVCVKPVDGYLLKGYSIDTPVFSLTMNDYRVHKGIDIASEAGSPVMAFAEGTVQNVYNDPMMGNCITIAHSNGIVSCYMGLSDEQYDGVYEGAPVYCGQPIGSVGDSTLVEIAEEDHVHFELTQNGKYIDPLSYVSYSPVPENREEMTYEG